MRLSGTRVGGMGSMAIAFVAVISICHLEQTVIANKPNKSVILSGAATARSAAAAESKDPYTLKSFPASRGVLPMRTKHADFSRPPPPPAPSAS